MARYYSNHQNIWQKFRGPGPNGAEPRCRPWQTSARLRPPPHPTPLGLPCSFTMYSGDCYRIIYATYRVPSCLLCWDERLLSQRLAV